MNGLRQATRCAFCLREASGAPSRSTFAKGSRHDTISFLVKEIAIKK